MGDVMASQPKKSKQEDAALYAKASDISKHDLPEICFTTHGTAPSTRFQKSQASRTKNKSGSINRNDWYDMRPEDRIPTSHEDIILAIQVLYRKIGIVRNIIDMMSDFASEGLELEHPIKSQKRFYEKWAKKVDLQSRAHDFMKLLLRDANVIIRRKNAKITVDLANEMARGSILSNLNNKEGPKINNVNIIRERVAGNISVSNRTYDKISNTI